MVLPRNDAFGGFAGAIDAVQRSAQAAAASLAEGEFSHELRTRLNPLRLPLETFLADIVANPESVSDPVVRRRAASLERDTRELGQ